MTTHERLLRRVDVERYCQIGRSTIYRLMREGLFPVPIRVGPRAVRRPRPPPGAGCCRRSTSTTTTTTCTGSQAVLIRRTVRCGWIRRTN